MSIYHSICQLNDVGEIPRYLQQGVYELKERIIIIRKKYSDNKLLTICLTCWKHLTWMNNLFDAKWKEDNVK